MVAGRVVTAAGVPPGEWTAQHSMTLGQMDYQQSLLLLSPDHRVLSNLSMKREINDWDK